MKRSLKFTALLLAMLMMITSFVVVALGEGESTDPNTESTDPNTESSESGGETPPTDESSTPDEDSTTSENESSTVEPDPNAFTVNIEGATGADVYFDNAIVGNQFVGTTSPISIRVEPKPGYKIISAEFDYGGAKAILTETDGKFSGTTLTLSAGYTYTLKIVTEAVPVPVTLSVETVGATGYTVLANGTAIDLSATQIMSGTEITVTFAVEGNFDSTLANLTENDVSKTMTSQSYVFVITANTKIVFTYGNLIPITVTFTGPGTVEFQKTLDSSPVEKIVNESTATVTKTFYAKLNEGLKVITSPSMGYALDKVEISEPRRDVLNNIYFFIPSGATTVNVNVKESQGQVVVPTNCTIQVNVYAGGKFQANGQTVLGGMGTNIVLAVGDNLTFTVIPDEGYVVDVVKIGGTAVNLTNNSYTITNITASTNISVLFKSNSVTPPEENSGIGVNDIDWNANTIAIDVRGNKLVKSEVFAKIATLPAGDKYVEFRSENGTVYIPYGKKVEGSATVANMSINPLTSGALYDVINDAIIEASGGTAEYKAYSLAFGISMPEGTLISFKLGTEFIGSSAVMLLYDSSSKTFYVKQNAPIALETLPDGTSEKYPYDDEALLIISKDNTVSGGITINASVVNEGGSINPNGVSTVEKGESKTYYITSQDGFVIKQILVNGQPVEGVEGQKVYSHPFTNIQENCTISVEFMPDANAGTENDDGSSVTTIIVILIIVLVAVAGAAALFIVKWRQEKF